MRGAADILCGPPALGSRGEGAVLDERAALRPALPDDGDVQRHHTPLGVRADRMGAKMPPAPGSRTGQGRARRACRVGAADDGSADPPEHSGMTTEWLTALRDSYLLGVTGSPSATSRSVPGSSAPQPPSHRSTRPRWWPTGATTPTSDRCVRPQCRSGSAGADATARRRSGVSRRLEPSPLLAQRSLSGFQSGCHARDSSNYWGSANAAAIFLEAARKSSGPTASPSNPSPNSSSTSSCPTGPHPHAPGRTDLALGA